MKKIKSQAKIEKTHTARPLNIKAGLLLGSFRLGNCRALSINQHHIQQLELSQFRDRFNRIYYNVNIQH